MTLSQDSGSSPDLLQKESSLKSEQGRENLLERKCIICNKDMPKERILTCRKDCATIYNRLSNKLRDGYENKCLICRSSLEIEKGIVCLNCLEIYNRVKEHIKRMNETNLEKSNGI